MADAAILDLLRTRDATAGWVPLWQIIAGTEMPARSLVPALMAMHASGLIERRYGGEGAESYRIARRATR